MPYANSVLGVQQHTMHSTQNLSAGSYSSTRKCHFHAARSPTWTRSFPKHMPTVVPPIGSLAPHHSETLLQCPDHPSTHSLTTQLGPRTHSAHTVSHTQVTPDASRPSWISEIPTSPRFPLTPLRCRLPKVTASLPLTAPPFSGQLRQRHLLVALTSQGPYPPHRLNATVDPGQIRRRFPCVALGPF